jgi:hypothetical protein
MFYLIKTIRYQCRALSMFLKDSINQRRIDKSWKLYLKDCDMVEQIKNTRFDVPMLFVVLAYMALC